MDGTLTQGHMGWFISVNFKDLIVYINVKVAGQSFISKVPPNYANLQQLLQEKKTVLWFYAAQRKTSTHSKTLFERLASSGQ